MDLCLFDLEEEAEEEEEDDNLLRGDPRVFFFSSVMFDFLGDSSFVISSESG